jgi:hypothetical protein
VRAACPISQLDGLLYVLMGFKSRILSHITALYYLRIGSLVCWRVRVSRRFSNGVKFERVTNGPAWYTFVGDAWLEGRKKFGDEAPSRILTIALYTIISAPPEFVLQQEETSLDSGGLIWLEESTTMVSVGARWPEVPSLPEVASRRRLTMSRSDREQLMIDLT